MFKTTGPQIEIIYKTHILVILSKNILLLLSRGDLFNFETMTSKEIVRQFIYLLETMYDEIQLLLQADFKYFLKCDAHVNIQ